MLKLRIESGDAAVSASHWEDAVYVAAGHDPFELAERAVCQAAALSGGARPRREKIMPPTLDVFGWCTWDAFYSRVSARGTLVSSLECMFCSCSLVSDIPSVLQEDLSLHDVSMPG